MTKLLSLALLALALLFAGTARADTHSSRQEAYAHCMSEAQRSIQNPPTPGNGYNTNPHCVFQDVGYGFGVYGKYLTRCTQMNFNGTVRSSSDSCYYGTPVPNPAPVDQHFWQADGCPSGTTWDEVNKTCYSRDQCLAKPALGNGVSKNGGFAVCSGGCEFKPKSVGMEFTFGDGTKMTASQGWTPSGNACASNAPPPPDTTQKQECKPVGTMTMCVKPDGKLCASATTGKQFCWNPGETGTKTDGADMQKRDAGNQPIPPSLQLPSGDSLSQQGQPNTTTSNTTNTSNNSSSTSTTTISNYKTQYGTNASGGQDGGQGEPSDGSGSGEEGDGTGASGGGNCETPPVVTGDAALNMVATQAWATRCAVEAGNAAKVTGDITNCTAPWSVEGSNANAIKLRAMRAQLCPNLGDAPNPGAGETADDRKGVQEVAIDGSNLDSNGWMGGANSCPAIATSSGGEFSSGFVQYLASPPPMFCQYIAWLRAILITIATITAIYILKG